MSFFAKHCEYFSGADIKALLYNAQLEGIHELTGRLKKTEIAQTSSETKLRPTAINSLPLNQKVASRRRHRSFSSFVTYIPKLEEGVAQNLSEELEERLNFQVFIIYVFSDPFEILYLKYYE